MAGLRTGIWLSSLQSQEKKAGQRRAPPVINVPPKLYLLDMEATAEELPEPWELLQDYKPDGVICYFGAVAYHELTTQEPSFYPIATCRSPEPKTNTKLEDTRLSNDASEAVRPREPHGTLASFPFFPLGKSDKIPDSSHSN